MSFLRGKVFLTLIYIQHSLIFRLGIGYCFHPKCGTSTWSVFLGKILTKNGKATGNGTFSNKTPKGWDRFRWNKWRRLTSRLLNTKATKGQENLDTIFKFSIVRHPFVRLVSTYQVMAYCNFNAVLVQNKFHINL